VKTSEQLVTEFHRALDLPVGDTPAPITTDRLLLRLALIGEEVAEFVAAMTGIGGMQEGLLKKRLVTMFHDYARLGGGGEDLAAIADGACDVHVVVSGTCVEYGIPEDACYEAVHESNMAKVGGPVREDGKRLKPEGWKPPDLAKVIRRRESGGVVGYPTGRPE
jgi:predicted HAD superfamily Cof-like phosphohydrolase